jgi:hypothetical protein
MGKLKKRKSFQLSERKREAGNSPPPSVFALAGGLIDFVGEGKLDVFIVEGTRMVADA